MYFDTGKDILEPLAPDKLFYKNIRNISNTVRDIEEKCRIEFVDLQINIDMVFPVFRYF